MRGVSREGFSVATTLFTSMYQDLRALFRRSDKCQSHTEHLGEAEALGVRCLADLTSNLFRESEAGDVFKRLLSLQTNIHHGCVQGCISSRHHPCRPLARLQLSTGCAAGGAMSDDHLLADSSALTDAGLHLFQSRRVRIPSKEIHAVFIQPDEFSSTVFPDKRQETRSMVPRSYQGDQSR